MATSGRGSGVVGYNVQVAVDTEHHLIVTHEVTNVGSDRAQLAHVAQEDQSHTANGRSLEAVADRGYFSGEEILTCEKAGITVTLPKADDVRRQGRGPLRQAGLRLSARGGRLSLSGRRAAEVLFTTVENGLSPAPLLDQCLPDLRPQEPLHDGKERRITRWEHEHVIEAVQKRLDENPKAMRSGARRSSIPSARSRRAWAQPTS